MRKNGYPIFIGLCLSMALMSALGLRGRNGAYAAYDYAYFDAPLAALPLRGLSDGVPLADAILTPIVTDEEVAEAPTEEEPSAAPQTVAIYEDDPPVETTPPADENDENAEQYTVTDEDGLEWIVVERESVDPQTEADAPDAIGEDAQPVVVPAEPPQPVSGSAQDDAYYQDALFIGDSRTVGLSQYAPGLDENATFYCQVSLTIYGALNAQIVPTEAGYITVEEALTLRQFGKIYLMVGINEIGYGADSFIPQYQSVVNRIRELQPYATIYIQSIMHVSAAKQAAQPVFSNASINERNAYLAGMANGADIVYIDINYPLDDEQGALSAALTFDGVHLTAGAYDLWYQAIKAQTR